MAEHNADGLYDLGLVGLGVMGRNFVLNLADHGYRILGYDKDEERVTTLEKDSNGKAVGGARSVNEFVSGLKRPRAVMMLVPAGAPVDSVIGDIAGSLEEGDIIIDGGNSHFTDTNRHIGELTPKKIAFVGVGISGGADGARHGPSMMPGGARDAYERVRPMFEAAAANVDGEPCVAYLGSGSAGHYVKMVHNGIEYAVMQLIAESYDVMKRGYGFDDDRLHDVFAEWNSGELESFLLKITADIFVKKDDKTGKRLVDVILDEAKQKGTGKWTSQDAMDLQTPVPITDAAVYMRHMSAVKAEREAAAEALGGPFGRLAETPGLDPEKERQRITGLLKDALYFGMVASYAQGMSLLRNASKEYDYDLDLATVAKIWRDGCIIRAGMLNHIRTAFTEQKDISNLMLADRFRKELAARQSALREVVSTSCLRGIPVPGFMSTLSYYDAYRTARLPANLIQAQRDYFGSHTYERVDEKGRFHTQWQKLQ